MVLFLRNDFCMEGFFVVCRSVLLFEIMLMSLGGSLKLVVVIFLIFFDVF